MIERMTVADSRRKVLRKYPVQCENCNNFALGDSGEELRGSLSETSELRRIIFFRRPWHGLG